jgi:hypothetical protein
VTKASQRVDLTRTSRPPPLGLLVTFVILLATFSTYFTSSMVDEYNRHMLVRDHGADTLATITQKHISHGRSNSYYFEYSFVAAQGSSSSNTMTAEGAPKTYPGVSEDVPPSVFDNYSVGSKIKIRYSTDHPEISFLHIDDYLEAKRFQSSEIVSGVIMVSVSFMAAIILTLLASIPWLIWRGMKREKELNRLHDLKVLGSPTECEPEPGRSIGPGPT